MASEPLVIPERYKHAHSTLVGRRTKVCTLRLTWTDEQIISFIEEIARLEAKVKFLKSAPCPFEAENATLKDEIEAVALALLGPGATYQPAQLALEVAALKAQVERLSAPVSEEEWKSYAWATNTPKHTVLADWESINEMIAARKEAQK